MSTNMILGVSENPLTGNLNGEMMMNYRNLGFPFHFGTKLGSGIVLGISLLNQGFLFGYPILSIFHTICNNLELEAVISTAFAAFLNLNLSFSMVFAAFWCSNCSCNIAVCTWGLCLVLGFV